jgi:hypothetical protein
LFENVRYLYLVWRAEGKEYLSSNKTRQEQPEEPKPHNREIHKIVRDNLSDCHLNSDRFPHADQETDV